MRSEIIEVGLAPLDLRTLEVGDKRSIFVKPDESTSSEFCTELTTLTQADVDEGVSFSDACAVLMTSHRSGARVWASYGDYDRRMFQEQCERTGVMYPFGAQHIDVKTLFALSRGRSPIGMKAACDLDGRPPVGSRREDCLSAADAHRAHRSFEFCDPRPVSVDRQRQLSVLVSQHVDR
jgi:inhibitor of KinA sporulation pathway (predicted exonuclease)